MIPDTVTIARTLDIPCTKIGLLYKNESYQDDHGQRVLALCDFWFWGKIELGTIFGPKIAVMK